MSKYILLIAILMKVYKLILELESSFDKTKIVAKILCHYEMTLSQGLMMINEWYD